MIKRSVLVTIVALAVLSLVSLQLYKLHREQCAAAFMRGTLQGEIADIAVATTNLKLLDENDHEHLREGFEMNIMLSAMQARSILESGIRPESIGSPELSGLRSAIEYTSLHDVKGSPIDNLEYIQEVYTTLLKRFEEQEPGT